MGYNTKIDWCDTSWNPVTGCYHKCEYCYARGIATRFAGFLPEENPGTWGFRTGGTLVELDGMQARKRKDGKIVPAPYPYGFTPTLHRYRLDEPQKWTQPRTIFVCSMADLFGNWVPEEWIKAVFDACLAAPQHKYLFLTKNPFRYHALIDSGILPKDAENFWFGSTATAPNVPFFTAGNSKAPKVNTFLSIEPIHARFDGGPDDPKYMPDWIIVGAETGNRRDKVIPEKEWINELAAWCNRWYIPIFMKESLRELMGADFKQQFPWEAGNT